MRIKKTFVFFIALISLITLLCGCDVSDEDREKLYDSVIKTGDLQLDADVNDYENCYSVDNSPVPGGTTYYVYRGEGGETYTFNFKKTGSDETPYRVTVLVEYEDLTNLSGESDVVPGELTVTYQYTFNKNKVFKKMNLLDSDVIGYQLRFKEEDRLAKGGISNFSLYNGEVSLYFDVDYVDEKIVNYMSDYKSGEIEDIDIIIGTNQGIFSADRIVTVSNSGEVTYLLKAAINAEGSPEWVSIGDVVVDLRLR